MVGAMLDHSLERLLLVHIKPLGKDDRERLLYGTGPLSSFSAKIQIASAFGVIDANTAHDLDIIRDIRNAFGHASHQITFRNSSIRQRLEQLRSADVVSILIRAFRTRTTRHFDTVRGRFILAGMGYVRQLDQDRMSGKPKKAK